MARNPFEELEAMLERLGEQVEEGIVEGGGLPAIRAVPVDVVEDETSFVVTADLPGFEPEDVELTYQDGALHVEAHRESTTETSDEARYVQRERRTRTVSRTVRIPGEVDEANIEAGFTNGVLTVTLPKEDHGEDGHRIDIE